MKKKIILAKRAGFCFGVKRAVEMAEKALSKKNGRVFCLGEIIHNPQVVSGLEERGLETVFNLRKVRRGDTLIIRSHGVSPKIIEKAKKKGARVVDATCPFVKKAQRVAEEFQREGRKVIIFGDPNHPEVIGIKGCASRAKVIQSVQDLGKISRAGFLAQTTQKPDVFREISKELKRLSQDAKIADTICLDSFNKKKEVREIAKKVDALIVIGGKKSNNTRELSEVGRKAGAKTYQIETAREIRKAWIQKAEKIGVAAGASTPEKSILEVVKKIKSF
ncbi:MAG: 4-hydroxy-3-methylbut-2-enyl diphosphate reductase [Patescibacteria group bacterium]